MHVIEREDRWFERGVKEAIHVKLKKPSLNGDGGLRHFLSPTYNAVLHSLGQNSKRSHCLTRPDDSPTDKGEESQQKLGQRPRQRPLQRLSGDHPGHYHANGPKGYIVRLCSQPGLELMKPSGERTKHLLTRFKSSSRQRSNLKKL